MRLPDAAARAGSRLLDIGTSSVVYPAAGLSASATAAVRSPGPSLHATLTPRLPEQALPDLNSQLELPMALSPMRTAAAERSTMRSSRPPGSRGAAAPGWVDKKAVVVAQSRH